MKKLFKFLSVVIILVIILVSLVLYARPSEDLTMSYSPINLNEKINDMVSNLKTELVLNENDINALIKQTMNNELNEHMYITGAHYYIEDNKLQANVAVTVWDRLEIEMHATYEVSWQEPNLVLTPNALSLKAIPLPLTWLEPITTPLYNSSSTVVKITDILTSGKEIIVKWKVELFNW